MNLSVVIPAFNEAENIQKIVTETIRNIELVASIINFEIIVCDDHSTDDTIGVVRKLNLENVNCIRLSRRSGSHTAIRAGLVRAQGDVVLCISADGQDNANVLPEMINKIKGGKNIVWGVRSNREEPFLHRQFSILFYKLLNKFVPNEGSVNLANADFYVLDRRVVDSINSCQERNTSLFGLIAWIGFKQDEVRYERKDRYSGASKWNFKSKRKLTIDWIIAFSGIPLKLISVLGTLFASVGFLYALYIIALFLLGKTTPGWAETVILILIMGGIQMLMIGIIGEYLGRTLDEGRKRPLFFIEEETGNDK